VLLGNGTVAWEPLSTINIRDDKFGVYTFVQMHECPGDPDPELVPYHNTFVTIPVLLGSTEKIGYVEIRLIEPPASPLCTDVKTYVDAKNAVAGSAVYGAMDLTFSDEGNANIVIYEAEDGTLHRAWRFRGRNYDDQILYLFFVDTTTGDIVGVEDLVRYSGTVTVEVTGDTNHCCHPGRPDWPQCCCPAGEPDCSSPSLCCCEDTDPEYPECAYECCGAKDGEVLTGRPLPGIQVRVDGGESPVCPEGDELNPGWSLTDEHGEYSAVADEGDQVGARLTGDWVVVYDCESDPPSPRTRGVECGEVPSACGESCDVGLSFVTDGDYCYNSEVNAFLAVEQTHDWFADLQENFTGINEQVDVTFEKFTDACTAGMDEGRLNFHPGSASCWNTAIPTVITHEYTHFIYSQKRTRAPATLRSSSVEGMCDALALLMWDTDCYGWGYQVAEGGCKFEYDPVDDLQYQPGVDRHLIPQAFWDLRKELMYCEGNREQSCGVHADCDFGQCTAGLCDDDEGRPCTDDVDCTPPCIDRATEELFADFLITYTYHYVEGMLDKLLWLDDDDGDRSNGTPNCCEILCAFVGDHAPTEALPDGCRVGVDCACDQTGHGWPLPTFDAVGDGSVEVRWDLSGMDPVEGAAGDYAVDYQTEPPSVTLKTTVKDTVPIREWYISRYFDGRCAGGDRNWALCNGDEDCPWDGTCLGEQCDGGQKDGESCTVDDDCLGQAACQGTCALGPDYNNPCDVDADCSSNVCSRPLEVFGIGRVRAIWDGVSHNDVEIQIGTEVAGPCRNLGSVDVARQRSDKYVNVRLTLTGDLEGTARAYASDPGSCVGGDNDTDPCTSGTDCPGGACDKNGGRISGTIAGSACNVEAEAIGIGASGGGTLAVGSLSNGELETMPWTATLTGEGLRFKINGEHAGLIHVTGPAESSVYVLGTGQSTGDLQFDTDVHVADVTITGEMLGDIRVEGGFGTVAPGYIVIKDDMWGSIAVDGNIWADITIEGDMHGDILADADFSGEGEFIDTYGQQITIDGEFTGDFCTAGLAPPYPPSYFHANLFNGTICGLRSPHEPPEAHQARKNRYLSINPRSNLSVALQVTLSSMKRCDDDAPDYSKACVTDADCSGSCVEHPDVGTDAGRCDDLSDCSVTAQDCTDQSDCVSKSMKWVGAPTEPETGVYTSILVETPVHRAWPETVLHIGDCEIIPVATYEIRAMTDEQVFSDPLVIGTIEKPFEEQYGDVVGVLTGDLPPAPGWEPPDGFVNENDIQGYVLSYQGPSSPSTHPTWVDLYGRGAGSPPNYILNVSDLQRILFGYDGETWTYNAEHMTPADCPANTSALPPSGDPSTISLVASADIIDEAETVDVDVYVDSVDDLGAFELTLEVTGGTSGELGLWAITVDSGRQDYVFFEEAGPTHTAMNTDNGSLSHALEGGGVPVTGSGYLATYTYQPMDGATGMFTITVKGDENTFLNNTDGVMLATQTGATEVIGVGIDCFVDADCSAFACQTVTCTNYACIYTNLAQGTPCDDGQFCTATDECDGNGTCVGSGNACSFPLQCCELPEGCVCRTCSCLPE
jgi:hypothetical protein